MPRPYDSTPVNDAQQLLTNEENFNARQKGATSSALDSFATSWLGGIAGLQDIGNLLQPKPQPSPLHDLINHIQSEQNQIPDSGAKSVGDFIGSISGFALSPPSLAGTGLAAGAISKGAALLTEALPEVTSPTLNIAGRGVLKIAKGGAGAIGATTLSSLDDSYNPKNNAVNVPQFMKETAINGGIGMAFGVGEVAVGHIVSKLKAANIDATEARSLDKAVSDGVLTPKEKEFYQQATSKPEGYDINQDENLQRMANEISKANGLPEGDATGHVNLQLLSNADIENIHAILPYEIMSSDAEEFKPKISEYITNNALDKATSNDGLMNAVESMAEKHSQTMEQLSIKNDQKLGEIGDKLHELSINEPSLESPSSQLSDLYNKVKENKRLSVDDLIHISELEKKGDDIAKDLRNVLSTRASIAMEKDRLTLSKALVEYSKNRLSRSESEKVSGLVQHMQGLIESKILKSTERSIPMTNDSIIAQVDSMDESQLKAVADTARDVDEEFANEIDRANDMYEKVKNSKQLLDDFINCVRGG